MSTILLIISCSIGLFCMLCFNLHLALGFDICPVLSCGNKDIKFPFKIKGKNTPQYCGYPGFDLVCTANNETVIELPSSVKLSVNNIDYKRQRIVLHDTHECLISQLHNLTLFSSNFQFNKKILKDYNFFNCSLADRDLYSNYMVPCLTTPNSKVYAIPSYTMIESLPLSLCTKMFNISSFPSDFLGKDNILELLWSEPNCKDCERHRNRCGWKNYGDNNETRCFVNHKGSTPVLVTTGSVLGSLFAVFLVCAVYHFYDSYTLRKEKQAIFDKFLEDYRALKPTRYSHTELKRITNNFTDKLGEGAYGVVFKGSISKEFIVAVKMLNNSQGNGEEFINEVNTMGRIHHVNIVRMVGFCADGFKRALIYEFMPNGSLQNFKNSPNNKKSFLGWQKLYEITLGIAKGIEYLHQGCDQRIVHFDIKPQNVLLDGNFSPKICDFGLSKLCSKEQSLVSMTTARGTLGYIAPEVFSRNFGNVSYKSDVYSYGMMMLETIGGRKITEDIEENTSHVYYPEWIHNLLEEGDEMRVHIDDEGDAKIARKLAIVGLCCIQWHAAHRPSMQMVIQMLEGTEDRLQVPPNPFASAGTKRKFGSAGIAAMQLNQGLEVIQELE
ncbi:PREDICTED: rust resistance kinase Lr10-like isoform X2 [Lupinus angustifolius]|nr:PREDICTED: rust resistance kinase Lr10-like isoform X2 [Lupinus angustifolius]